MHKDVLMPYDDY